MNKLKYFIYISDSKVDMLYSQIPRQTRNNIATELKIDLKIISAKFDEQPPEKTRYSKLDVVTNYIKKHEDVGTINEPRNYFQGTIPMRWAQFPQHSYNRTLAGTPGIDQLDQFVYFSNQIDFESQNKLIVGLGGSVQHLVGYRTPSKIESLTIQIPHSSLPGISTMLFQLSEEIDDLDSFPNSTIGNAFRLALDLEGSGRKTQTPIQTMEFLARRLLEGEINNYRVIIGSPIYVALSG